MPLRHRQGRSTKALLPPETSAYSPGFLRRKRRVRPRARQTPEIPRNLRKDSQLDLKLIKQVIDLMKRAELSEFELEEEGLRLRLSRKNNDGPPQIVQAAPPPHAGAAPAPGNGEATDESALEEETDVTHVKSPMVGTFYRSPSPESDPFVDVGSKVGEESVVCIIEAMKVMNEIQAEVSGTITEALVENGEAVEYGQPLFKVKTG